MSRVGLFKQLTKAWQTAKAFEEAERRFVRYSAFSESCEYNDDQEGLFTTEELLEELRMDLTDGLNRLLAMQFATETLLTMLWTDRLAQVEGDPVIAAKELKHEILSLWKPSKDSDVARQSKKHLKRLLSDIQTRTLSLGYATEQYRKEIGREEHNR